MRKIILLLVVVILVLASCEANKKPTTIKIPTFIEGNDGLSLTFDSFKKEVLDGGQEDFDVTIKLLNKGAFDVPKDSVVVKISGIRPQEFNKKEEEFRKKAEADIIGKKVVAGKVQDGIPEFVLFRNLKYSGIVSGATLQLPLQAEACYLYNTKAVSVLCVRRDLLNPSEGICKIEESKNVAVSASPLKVENFVEVKRGKDKLGFSFNVKHVGSGNVYEKFSDGCELDRKKNRVYVRVSTSLDGLSCTGLTTNSKSSEGFVTLSEGPRTISCIQDISSKGDYETPVNIELSYDYSQKIVDQLIVKHVGGSEE